MRISMLVFVGFVILSPAFAQDRENAPDPAETPEPTEAPAVNENNNADTKAPTKPAADFQPSEEIMADTMLTLPADI